MRLRSISGEMRSLGFAKHDGDLRNSQKNGSTKTFLEKLKFVKKMNLVFEHRIFSTKWCPDADRVSQNFENWKTMWSSGLGRRLCYFCAKNVPNPPLHPTTLKKSDLRTTFSEKSIVEKSGRPNLDVPRSFRSDADRDSEKTKIRLRYTHAVKVNVCQNAKPRFRKTRWKSEK